MTKLLTVLNIFSRAAEISKLYFCDPDQHLTQIPHEQWTVVHLKLIQMSSFLVQLKFWIAIFSVILMTSHESPVEKWLEFKTTNYKCLGWPQKWRWGREIGGRQGGTEAGGAVRQLVQGHLVLLPLLGSHLYSNACQQLLMHCKPKSVTGPWGWECTACRNGILLNNVSIFWYSG